MMGFLNVLNWRDAASAACDCRAGVLGDQAVNAGQDPALIARIQSRRELTASNQTPDHTRGDAQAPRDPGLRNPLTSSLEHHEPHKRSVVSIRIPDVCVTRSQNVMVQPRSLRAGWRMATPTNGFDVSANTLSLKNLRQFH